MKIFWLVIIAAGLGIVFGVGTSSARMGWQVQHASLGWEPAEPSKTPQPPPAEGPPPKVVVDADEFDFGHVAFERSVEHGFRFSNQGTGPLKLESGGTTCSKCTVSRIPPGTILPGESAEVVVTYSAGSNEADFRQSATILTNDPDKPRVELTITGRVVVPTKISPNSVVLSRLSATETRTTEITIVAISDPDFAIKSFRFEDAESAPFFDVDIQPMSDADVEAERAKRGYKIALTVKPGMPLGPLRQILWLKTNLADEEDIDISISGSVDSDISIAGGHFDRDAGILRMGTVRGRAGAEQKLLVLIRGEHRHDVHVSVEKSDPPLQATLGEPSDLNAGAVVQIPLTVTIPRGSAPINHLSNYGKIMLETDDPNARRIRIWVQFAVEN
jgi:Protein of unknown function (DUF1573)